MRALIRLFGIAALVVASAAGAADEVSVPPLKARVTDLTGTLNPGQLASPESELRAFEQSKGSQIAVLMLPSTQPETIEQYSIRVAERGVRRGGDQRFACHAFSARRTRCRRAAKRAGSIVGGVCAI